MHPIREEIDKYLLGKLANAPKQILEKHLQGCDFCRELVDNLKQQLKWSVESLSSDLPRNLEKEADKIFDLSLRGRIIELIALESLSTGQATILAADGQLRHDRDVENVATVYSENPEIVLRLMKDNKADEFYVQVISDDPGLYENMLVEMPDISRSVVTDSSGRARIDNIEPEHISDMRWQIRLPDAVFNLEALSFNPDEAEYFKETILESELGDRIKISLEGRGDGKQIELEVLQLDGSTKIGPLQMVVTIDDNISSFQIDNNKSVVIESAALRGKIRIRLYT